MKKNVTIILLLVTITVGMAGLILIPPLFRAKRNMAFIETKNALMAAYIDREQGNTFTNIHPNTCRISIHTNCYAVSGTIYQSVMAADS